MQLIKTWSLLATAASAALLPPSQDPFYQPSGNWKDAKPGTILNQRAAPGNLTGITYSKAYQLLYRTVDALGQPIAAVTTIIIPTTPDYSKLLSYQIVYDTPDVNCSPSYTLLNGTNFDSGFEAALSFGWIVNTPDYEGPMAAFTNGIISGQATLDSIRAALKSANTTQIQTNATVAMWGYSGGALASEWAAELQSSYAPELNISGTALGGTTPNVSSVALTVNKGPDAGLAAAGILGIAAAYPNITSLLNSSFVSAADKSKFYAVKDECISQLTAAESGENIFGYFTEGESILTDPRTAFAIEAGGIMGIHGTPEKSNPLYVYKTTLDEVSPINDTNALVEKYCRDGLSIQYVKRNYGSHMEEAYNGGPGAFLWLAGVFAGSNNATTGCLVQTINSAGSTIGSSTIMPTASSSASSGSSSASATTSSGSSTSTTATRSQSSSGGAAQQTSNAAAELSPLHVGLVGAVAVLAAAL